MKWKSLFAAALSAVVAWPALAQSSTGGGTPSLSFSFANGRSGARTTVMPTSYESLGIHSVPVAQWIDLDDEDVSANNLPISATDVVAIGDTHANFTLPAPVYVAYSAANGWSYAGANTRSFLRTYLDDGGTGASITVDNVPFTKYDVIVYLATDTSGVKFLPVTVNGTKYKGTTAGSEVANDGDTWGTSCQDVANLGNNALRVNGLETATLTIKGSSNSSGTGARCGIAAFQIIQAEDGAIRESAYQPSISVNMKGNANTIVGTSGTSGLLPVPNAYWNELQTSAASGGSETIGALRDAAGETTSLSIGATYAGGAWSQASAGRSTLGDMANGYRDTKQLTLTAVPYSSYDVILYFASDLHGGEGASAKPWTPVQVTDANGASKWYSYPADYTVPESGEAKAADANPGDWGTTADCHTADTAVAYGKAVMKIAGLSGDVTLSFLRNTDGNDSTNRSGLYGFQIVCTGELLDLAPTISVNFADVRTPNAQGGTLSNPDADVSTTGVYGLAPVPGNAWANLRPATVGTDGTETITKAYACGLATPVRVSYQASGTDEYTGTTDAPVDSFLRYYLDDGVSANGQKSGADIYVTNIPFSKYDVIVYLATDSDGEKFNPVEINDTLYKGTEAGAEEASSSTDVWGTVRQTAPALGANALRVSGLKGNLRIHGGTKQTVNNQVARGGIAAFQIVLADDGEILESVAPDRGVLSLNFNSNRNNNSSNNSVPNTNAFYGLDAVPGWAWYDSPAQYANQGSSAIVKEEFVNVAYGPVLETAPQVTISAANGYGYSSNDPFMRAYLDDNARVNISSEVPYDYYDVIVYSATDGTGSRFQAVGVNGTDYRWHDTNGKPVVAGVGELFGWGGRDAAFGQNAQRINGQTANPLTVSPRTKDGSYRSGIAAIQIIERPVQEIEVNASMTAQQVFAQSLPGRVPKLVFAEGGTITGAVNLSGVAVDLTQVASSPFTGDLTVNANTKLYLPNVRTYTLTTGSVTGTLAAGNVFVGGTAIPANDMKQEGATLTFDVEVTYNWTGAAGDNLWSTAANWSGNAVPKADSKVTVTLEADDAKTIVIDTAEATANLFYISGPQTGSATLEIVAAENVEGAKLTVVENMLTTGKVAVTQRANVAVNGATQTGMVDGYGPFAIQTGFQVNGSGAKYTVASGALVVQVPDRTAGDVSVSNGATLEVGEAGSLYAAQAIASYFGNATSAASGTLSIAGTATFSKAMGLRTDKFTVKLVGGTMTAPRVNTFHGLTVSAPSVLKAPDGLKMTVSGTTKALTGAGSLTLQGAVTFSSAITTAYTGELIAAADSTVTLGTNRPKLSVVKDATVEVTPTDGELAVGAIAFDTTMETVSDNVTFKVSGVEEAITPSVANGVLTLAWKVSLPTISADAAWGTAASWSTGTVPATGTVVLDGTAEDGITVTLDTAIPEEITSIILRGNVTLVTSEAQGTIPASVTFGENVVLTVGAVRFASGWTLPSGATLKVTDTKTSLFGVTLKGVVELAFSGTTETPATYSAPVSFFGGLTVSGSEVSITDVQLLGDAETRLTGNNVSLTFSGMSFYTSTTLINKGTGNKLLNIQNLNGEILANAGTLTLEVALVLNEETSTEENPVYVQNVAPVFKGLTIAEGATVTFTGVGTGGQFAVTGAGTLDMGTFRKQLAGRDGTLVKNLRVTATDDEQKAGEIRFLVQGSPALPEGFQVVVTPAEGAAAWEPTWDLNGQNLVIRNVPPTPVMSVTGNWSAGPWSTGTAPTTGEVILDGGSNGIVVTMDTALDAAIAVTVRGAVTLKTSATQTTLPDNITLEEGASLGVEYAAATTDDISDLAITRGLAITGDNVTVTAGTISGAIAVNPDTHNGRQDTIRFYGDNGRLTVTTIGERSGIHVDKNATGNVLVTETFTSGTIVSLVSGTSLSINTCTGLGGVDIQANATLTLTADCTGGELHATGAGILDMSAIAAENRPTIARWSNTVTNIPATIRVTASEAENTAGKVELDLVVPSGNNDTAYVTLPEGFVAQVTYGLAQWDVASTVISEDHSKLVITKAAPDVSPSLPEGSTLSETATAALNTAATEAGFTGEYAVAITTGGATVQVTTAEAATQLQEVLDCFTGLTLKASTEGGNTVTVVYDFGVVGIKRNTSGDGWVVTAKVQGENAAPAGFAEGNAYALTVKVPGETGSERNVNVQTVDETSAASGTVELTVLDTALGGVGDGFTVGVSVSRNAPEL